MRVYYSTCSNGRSGTKLLRDVSSLCGIDQFSSSSVRSDVSTLPEVNITVISKVCSFKCLFSPKKNLS